MKGGEWKVRVGEWLLGMKQLWCHERLKSSRLMGLNVNGELSSTPGIHLKDFHLILSCKSFNQDYNHPLEL